MSDQPPWFAFVVHPRDMAELLTMPGGSLLRRYSTSDEEFARKALSNPPVVCDEVAFTNSTMRGEIIGVPHLPETILTPDGNRAVVDAVCLAAERGGRVVGLGALTAPATAGGRALLRHLPGNVTLTNGNGLTAAVVQQNVREAGAITAGDTARVAVLGATGSVGYALSRLLAEERWQLTLIGPSEERVQRMFDDLLDRVDLAADVTAVKEADIILSLTNARSAALTPDLLHEGAVVVDIAQPPNVSDNAIASFAMQGIAVARGGVVQAPGFSCSRDFGLALANDCFACLAETFLLAREGLREHSVGHPSADYARAMAELAARHEVLARPLDLSKPPALDIPKPLA